MAHDNHDVPSMQDQPSSDWKHDGVRVVRSDQLDGHVPSTPGMDRKAAINFARVGAQKLWAGTVHIHPNAKTGAHHHGPLESVIYVVKGRARMPSSQKEPPTLSEEEVSSIIGMAWSDDTPFEAIALQFGLNESGVIALMRDQLKARSFRVWRMRMRGRTAKHGGRQKQGLQSQTHASHPAVQSVALDALVEENFPAQNSPLSPASLR